MPLTPTGQKVLSNMTTQYGSKEKGKRVFYATANKRPQLGAKWHAKKSMAGGKR